MTKSLYRVGNSIKKKNVKTKWPKTFFDFPSIQNAPDFASFRKDLKKKTSEDPLK